MLPQCILVASTGVPTCTVRARKRIRDALADLNFAGYVCQAVFVCKTCPQTDPAGMCYSCSISCHADHTILELYSKRAFRCDCGNSKFKGEGSYVHSRGFFVTLYHIEHRCRLIPDKESVNAANAYNQNFQGLYCICKQAYCEETDTMLECIICQDWFHDTCLGEVRISGPFSRSIKSSDRPLDSEHGRLRRSRVCPMRRSTAVFPLSSQVRSSCEIE